MNQADPVFDIPIEEQNLERLEVEGASDSDNEIGEENDAFIAPPPADLVLDPEADNPLLANLEGQSQLSTTSHRVARALYGDMDRRQRENLSYQIMLSIFIDFTIYLVPVTVLGSHINFEAQCGIPLTNWLCGLLVIIGLFNLQKLLMYTVVQYCRASRFIYGIVSGGLVFTLLFGWLVYGNLMYFSRKNDCVRQRDTRVLAYLVLAYLYVGYIQIGYALSYVYIVPHAIMKYYQLKTRERQFHNQIQ